METICQTSSLCPVLGFTSATLEVITKLVEGLARKDKHQVLKGATGTGKTFTIANVIQQVQFYRWCSPIARDAAAQLYWSSASSSLTNAVEYRLLLRLLPPEAYIPQHDPTSRRTPTSTRSSAWRTAATAAVLTRRDCIVVASVSAIYALGSPEEWGRVILPLQVGQAIRREMVMRHLVDIYYDRNDLDFKRGTFRARGDVLEVRPAYTETAFRISVWGDEIESIVEVDPLTGEVLQKPGEIQIFPAKHYVTSEEKTRAALIDIEAELEERLAELNAQNKLLEAQRLEQCTKYDLEMIREIGYCSGIENYSRHLDRRKEGEPPWTLIDYFPADYLLVMDESHMSVPQVRGMYNGDRSRKGTLVDFGFRLPSALDNRPLMFHEFEERVGQVIYTSATPAEYELAHASQVVDQVIRPTGVVDPQIIVLPTKGQIDDLVGRLRERIDRGQRALVTTLTKKMAEDLSDYLRELSFKVNYLHSEVQTIERVEILRIYGWDSMTSSWASTCCARA